MEERYYTPKIEEFYAGFEFELLEHTHDEPNGVWTQSVYGHLLLHSNGGMFSTDLQDANDWVKEEVVRVKYLDHEDLKELGWEVSKLRWQFNFKNGQYFLVCDIHTSKEDIPLPVPNRGHISIMDLRDGAVIFWGYIKNKSELKKLMCQLNILEFNV